MTSSPSSLLDHDAVFPRQEGGVAWVPSGLPVVIADHELSMTVAEFIAASRTKRRNAGL